MRNIKTTALFVIIIFFSITGLAIINFQPSFQDTIDIEAIEMDKKTFFDFVHQTILHKKPGLGKYGRVAFHPCDMKIGELKIIDYKSKEGKELRFFSNPSCNQIILRRVLENSYQYDKASVTSYHNRQCLLSVEKIISPLLEYYTLKYEVQKMGDCNACEFKEKERLDLILATQKKVLQHCHSQAPKVIKFITELDSQIEASYKSKSAP